MIRAKIDLKQLFFLPGLLLLALVSSGQQVLEKIENYATKFSIEKAYLHYDKSTYSPGETIWFKAYLLNDLTPVTVSKTFYVDWIDEKGNVLQHSSSPIVNGATNGQFDIPATYKGTTLSVRAYTRWMLNFDSSFLYARTLPVLVPDSAKKTTKPAILTTVEFFPEGGDMVAGISNKIAFKATDQWGQPVKIKGVVSGEDGKKIDSLRVQHDGMGYFYIVPQPGVSYKAKWKDEKNIEKTTNLPAAKTNGITLQVAPGKDKQIFLINISPDFAQTMDSLHVVGTLNQHAVFLVSKATRSGKISVVLPTDNLPYGVLTVTVFDKTWKPLAERISYIHNQDAYIVKPAFEVERWGLSYRARDEIKISIPESFSSSISIAVTDLAIGADSSENILSRLMLTSDLKGRVHHPAYYFKDSTEKVRQDLDLVMLTHGWRRFNWEAVLSGNHPKLAHAKDTSYLSLSGKVLGVMPGQIGTGASVMVLLKQKDAPGNMFLIPVERDGSFNDASLIFFDTAKVYYQLKDKVLQGALVQFMPYKLRMPAVSKNLIPTLFPDTSGSAYHLGRILEARENAERTKYKELETVTIKARGKSQAQLLDEKYASGMFTGEGIQFDLVNDPFSKSALDIFTYLQGKVAGLQISGQGNNASLNWRGGAPQLYIDEVPADVSFVATVNPSDVAFIKVFRPPFMGGFNGANGAIAIYTRKGDDIAQESSDKKLSDSRLQGYTAIREFYSPKYYSREIPAGTNRDVRTTLYWNPNVAIDPLKKEILLSFYNNDVTDAFRVVIEGITSDGRLLHYTTTME